ncbi:FAD-dependent oxidoreductase [Paenibacillus sp. LHD-117]|uniref:NAD(P)/FAD-dependent oxidoreductase n=1 Tax=Paenibacillus sp. LHD-117 TaxID=3071412 RepID=UPI0027E1595B|nr:FAD-dependent oxidoreductase [Paenibacillus sp. LHD-117]MDQ6420076.1 FAD-dependent oxidoreductase [Paenibacillus sp. LHD-117]
MSELHIGRMYWPTTVADVRRYAPLSGNVKADVAIVGGGMSGVTCAHELSRAGMDVVLAERGEIAGESTTASTGLLQFCNDIMLTDLSNQIGKHPARMFYKACRDAMEQLAAIADSLPYEIGFKRRSSLYYASSEQDLPKLKEEFDALSACGLDVAYWTGDDVAKQFPFRKPGAILTGGDAEVNPFRFVHAIAESAFEQGLRIYEGTDITSRETLQGGSHRLHASSGHHIDAEHVVYAVGYEPESLRGRLIKPSFGRTFVIVTDKQRDLSRWHDRCLLWETARPYLYLRTTDDGRIIAGGLDEAVREPLLGGQSRQSHNEKLLSRVQALFPDLPLTADFAWNATFGESQDNLPFIGEDPDWPNVYYSLGYGGNGTVYSMLAATLIGQLIDGTADRNPIKDIVSLSRATLKER